MILKVHVEGCQKWIVKISGAPNENNILSKILKNVFFCVPRSLCPLLFRDIFL